MSIKYEKLLEVLENVTDSVLPEDWDNCGVQLYTGKPKIGKALLCLEITKDIIKEAIEKKVDIIITHHPLIFRAISLVDNNSVIGNYIIELARADISVYSAHTNFDKLCGGNNTRLSKLIGLTNIAEAGTFLGNIGELDKPMTLNEICIHVANVLDLLPAEIRIAGSLDKKIKKIGLCTGAGSEFIENAKRCGCDLFITGDVGYHAMRNAKEMDIAVIDAGHFGTEKIFAENMKEKLLESLKKHGLIEDLEIIVSQKEENPLTIMPSVV